MCLFFLILVKGDPDTEFQGKQELQDGERFFQKPQNEDDLFDDSFQAPPTPCSSSTKSELGTQPYRPLDSDNLENVRHVRPCYLDVMFW